MQFTYDYGLAILSVVIAIQGSYVGLLLAKSLSGHSGAAWKVRFGAAAVSLGVAIWAMHFIGMLAVRLDIPVGYDVLLTLVSALVAALVVGAGLCCGRVLRLGRWSLGIGGAAMGAGIAGMHYIGMAALTGVTCTFDPVMVSASVAVGMGSSMLGLWLLFVRGPGHNVLTSAVALGAAISGMHYTAMAAATFEPLSSVQPVTAPAMSNDMLAIIVAIIAFAISAVFFLTLLPDEPGEEMDAREGAEHWSTRVFGDMNHGELAVPQGMAGETPRGWNAGSSAAQGGEMIRIPVNKDGKIILLAPEQVYAARADAHYTSIFDGERTYFCSLSISELEDRVRRADFVRVHRSHLVNLRHAQTLRRNGEQGVLELDGDTPYQVPVSRTRLKPLKVALGV
ncbi:MHYT domain-containing protein [Breoghania sp. L-A4]|uniref:MHYT domain-containing protein n=1 Tax=Breoghania sp. L-A4 TaxID=2304600 RepID=UPI0013C2F784|nr:MHYT domain-containing protein [Breoghania sp. L-A4]